MSDLDQTRFCTCLAVRKLSRQVTAHYEGCFSGSGLKATQFTILSMVVQAGPLSIGRLATMLETDRTTISHNLRPLERRSLITLDRGDDDPRMRHVSATKAGRALAFELLPRWQDAQRTVHEVLASRGVRLNPVEGIPR